MADPEKRGNPEQYYHVLRRPLVTEKTTSQLDRCNQYAFEVASTTNKVEIRQAVETLFGVQVEAVNVVKMPSKRRRMFGRPGLSKPWKKAIVTLRDGDSIEVS
ncbi:MAG: 50S ribosomal protein L23 [Planctomycetes bacterium]|nr:50S ribosomal protein L23 [Planctomycetota bacterium]